MTRAAALRDAGRSESDRSQSSRSREASLGKGGAAPEIYPWSAEELATFLRWADQQGCLDAVDWRALAFTGMRRGEALALRWRDLDVEASRVSVRRSVGLIRTKGEGAQLVEGPTKSGRERVIDLDPQTLAASRGWRVARAGLDLRLARDDALIFSALDGGHQHPERLSRRFKEGLARCGRQFGDAAPPMVRLHDLRHTHATLMLKAGVPVKVVSERLGHSGPMITMTIYQHVMPGMQA